MRPLRLTLQGFCAYAGRQEIDFAGLAGNRLFLIAGPTGAGKTSLLDALCFALFGESSGEERGPQHLRSHHADPALPTEVTLDFALGNAIWRIRRRPQWDRPKRGGGTTRVGGEVELCELHGEETGKPLDRDAEVRAKVEELLGYRAAEFRQVVLLPQGRFRELLVAKPGDRQDILTRLFQTALYRRIEQRLAEDAKAAAQECQRLGDRRRVLLDQAGAADHAAAAAALEAQAAALTAAEAAQAEAATAEAAARGAAEAGREAARRLEEAAAAIAARDALQAKLPAVREAEARLEAARRADRLRGAQAGFEAAAARAAEAQETAAAADLAQATARAALARAEAALADAAPREAEAAAQQAEATRLSGLLDQAEKAAAATRSAAEASRAAQLAAARRTTAETAAAERSAAAQAAAEALAACEAVAAQRERHRLARDAAEAAARDLAALEAAGTALRRAEAAAEAQRLALSTAAAAAETARAARQAGAAILAADHAARLAMDLREGEPCPVCGGTHHLSPARPAAGDALPDMPRLEAAEQGAMAALDRARPAAAEAETGLRLAAQARDDLLLRLGEAASRPAEAAGAALRTARAALAEAEAAAAALPSLRSAAEAARGAAEAAAAEAGEALAAAQSRATEAAAAAATRDAVLGALPPGLAAPEALRQAGAAAAARARTLAEALRRDREARAGATAAAAAAEAEAGRAGQAARLAEAARAAQEAALLGQCAAAGFDGIAGFRAALMAGEAQATLTDRIEQFRDRLAAAEARAAAAGAAAEGLAPPDLAALGQALQAAEAAHRAAIDAAAAQRERLAAGRRLLGEIEAAERARAVAEAAYAVRQDLAEMASGRNRKKLSLEGFVLRSLLDEALASANQRLRGMLKGRYTIRRVEEPERANRAVGLDIEVLDEWSGAARPAGTLSGGEGFCASLALALGLADTVQAHAGARRIDALFVDEGFGTLDAEALETAMEVLSALQDQDRIVGVISHVAELRDWIPAKLEVTPGRRGSTAAFRIG